MNLKITTVAIMTENGPKVAISAEGEADPFDTAELLGTAIRSLTASVESFAKTIERLNGLATAVAFIKAVELSVKESEMESCKTIDGSFKVERS